MEKINLNLGRHSYPIYIGPGLLDHIGSHAEISSNKTIFIITNDSIAPLYLNRVKKTFSGCRVDTYVIPDGESYKNLDSLGKIVGELLKAKHTRSTTLVALGGGVIGDLGGYAAASYQRGVDFIQIPTTLLAQVDSSVGGKTAVNHPLGKNMIGAFHQPKAVYIDLNTLKSLPPRELSAGLAEVIKHGAIFDETFFSWIEDHIADLVALDMEAMAKAVRRSCEIKASIVAQDEKESNVRALLNLGHTFGHAIEHFMGYGRWLHGEAVGVGLVMAADLSVRLGKLNLSCGRRVKELVKAAKLPVSPPPSMAANDFIESMSVDKKATDSGLRFIVLNKIGDAEMVEGVSDAVLLQTLTAGEHLLDLS